MSYDELGLCAEDNETELTMPTLDIPTVPYPYYWDFEFEHKQVYIRLKRRWLGLFKTSYEHYGYALVDFEDYKGNPHTLREIITEMNAKAKKIELNWRAKTGKEYAKLLGPYLPKGSKIKVGKS